MQPFTVDESGAFIEPFKVAPTRSGPLDGLTFAVKDLADVAGTRTGRGSPAWRASAPAATVSAVCVEQLLAAGATCVGKTITDELAYSLLGENHHYGTPLNPAAADRVPGGSSSGSAAAVACGLVDFAIGTDTGGSVRIPASNCGIWGWRPSHGLVSVAGVMPLAPSFDTVGILARDAQLLCRASNVLLGDTSPNARGPQQAVERPASLRSVTETIAGADADVREAFQAAAVRVSDACKISIQETSLRELCADGAAADLDTWSEIYRQLVGAEAVSCHADWLAVARPVLGPMAESGFKRAMAIDRSLLNESVGRRERYAYELLRAIGPRDLLCLPTAPTIAPLKGQTLNRDRNSEYYRRTLAFGAIAGVGRLPQVSMPMATASGAPIGISLIAARGEDAFLVKIAQSIGKRFAS